MNQERSAYINTGTLESPCCNMASAAKAGPVVGTFEWARLDDESTRYLALRGADVIRLIATTHPAETQARLRDSADGIERLCGILDGYYEQVGRARSAVREANDKIGKLNAACEQREQEIQRLREQLAAKRKARRRSKVKA